MAGIGEREREEKGKFFRPKINTEVGRSNRGIWSTWKMWRGGRTSCVVKHNCSIRRCCAVVVWRRRPSGLEMRERDAHDAVVIAMTYGRSSSRLKQVAAGVLIANNWNFASKSLCDKCGAGLPESTPGLYSVEKDSGKITKNKS